MANHRMMSGRYNKPSFTTALWWNAGMIVDSSVHSFLDDLASRSPTPGGGSAAAIMGAMGAALVSMVCNLTLGKKGYESVEGDMAQTLDQAEALRNRLTGMVKADVDVFDRVMAAYGLAKDTDDQKSARSAAIQDALKAATDVPLACARDCAAVIRLCHIAAEKGNRNVVSDAGVAVAAAHAALKSAALNVHVNTGAIRDGAFVSARLADLETIMAGIDEDYRSTYDLVQSRL